MAHRLLKPIIFAGWLTLVLPASGQDDPRPVERKKESALPEGAKVRLGIGIPFRYSSGIALLPPDYKSMLVRDGKGGIHRFDLSVDRNPAKPIVPVRGHNFFSANGKRYVNYSSGKLNIRDVESGKAVGQIEVLRELRWVIATNVATVSLNEDGTRVAQGGESMNGMGVAVVHDVATGEMIFQAPMQYGGPTIPVLSSDGKMLATRRVTPGGGRREKEDSKAAGSVQIWDVNAGGELFRAPASSGKPYVTGFAFSADGSMIALSGLGAVDVWDVAAKKHRFTVLGRPGQGMGLAFSPDGKTLAAIAQDGTIQRWNTADGKLRDTTESPVSRLSSASWMAFADNERVIAWGQMGEGPMVWEAPSGKPLISVPVHPGPIQSVAFAAGDKEIVTAGSVGRIVRWEAATGHTKGEYHLKVGHGESRNIAILSLDGTKGFVSGPPGALYDLSTGVAIFGVPGGLGGTGSRPTVSSPDLKTVICFESGDGRTNKPFCRVWDLEGQKKLAEVEIPTVLGRVTAAISPSGERLVVAAYLDDSRGSSPATIVIEGWDIKTGKRLGTVEWPKLIGDIQIVAASESIAIVNTQGKARLIDFESGKLGEEIETGLAYEALNVPHMTSPVVFSPDRKRFALGVGLEEPGTFGVRVFEWPSVKPLHTFKGHTGAVSALRFSDDGKLLASGSSDGTTFVWDLSTIGK